MLAMLACKKNSDEEKQKDENRAAKGCAPHLQQLMREDSPGITS
jgi:hypothetical protein